MASVNDFLSNLGDVLSQQFDIGDNKNRSLDIVQDGQTNRFGKLGDFAKNFDQSAQRSYTEEGAFRVDYYNIKPKQLEIIMQEPNLTVMVKKRAFASLAENFRPDLMDEHEKLFYKATKVLLQNKCRQISSYEKLSKINQISSAIGNVDYHLLPIIFSLTDNITQLPGSLGLNGVQDSVNGSLSGFKNIVDRVREIFAMSQDSPYTTWLTNIPDSFRTSFGEGTGVIEFTNVARVSTNSTLDFAQGNFSLEFVDPYNIMRISNLDIEQAISDTINKFYSNSFIQLGQQSLDETINLQKNLLNQNRTARGAYPIIFLVEPDTFLGKRVRAIVDVIGFEINFDANSFGDITGSINIDPSALFGSSQAGTNGLTPDDISIFNTIVSSLYNQVSLAANTRRQAIADNQDTKKNLNKLRQKLRLHYGSKLVVQPMDNVHIYIQSKKQIDTKITGGLQSSFSGMGFLQGVNNLVQDIKDVFAISENYNLEKSIFVGNDFPNWLWMAMRNQFISEKDGAHVFAGVVEQATSNFNSASGTFNVSITGNDNAAYFNYGVVNFNPSIDQFNGPLHDPMTPFKLDFDSVTGVQSDQSLELLDENKNMFNSAFVKDKNGLYAGLQSSEHNFLLQDADRVKNNSVRRVFYDPEGMVYRWKEGIASLVLFGDSYDQTPLQTATPAITSNPFAGQDVMNVLSLLISGEPYNFTTFYKAAVQFDNFKRDPGTNQDPSHSYFRQLKEKLKYRNLLYGNFVPFKTLTIDEASYAQIINHQLNAIQYDGELQSLLQQRASLADKLAIFGKSSSQDIASSGTPEDKSIAAVITTIDNQISGKINAITNELNQKGTPPITITGNDISFNYDSSNLNSGNATRLNANARKELRRKINFLTRRLSWKVRANEDVNFLIIDDTYDKDYDIQAFEKSFVNPEIFKNEYITVADKIRSVGDVLRGLEIFCNPQGHIEVRVPKYNRVPSSVFQRMLRLKDEFGIQLYPQFLEDLSANQLSGAYQQIEILEDEIRLYCLALGYVDDSGCASFINSIGQGTMGNVKRISSTPGGFKFLSNEDTGKLNIAISLNALSDPSVLTLYIQTFTPQTSLNIFNLAGRAALVQSAAPVNSSNPTQFANLPQLLSSAAALTRQQIILNRLQGKTSMMFDINQVFNSGNGTPIKTTTVSSTAILQISNEVASRISERQNAIKSAVNALKSIKEGITLATGNNSPNNQSLGNNVLYQNSYPNRQIPKTFEHMIEDESYDDLGPGSGTRYVIKNRDIKNCTILEKKPPFTYIEVTGRFGDLFFEKNSGQLPQDLNVFQSGNALTTAAAVDYDLWRMYGIFTPQSIDAPYLTDPDTQLAPYAVSLLNKVRKEIISGTVEIVGNEYQQPGEVVYLEHLDMLFYVTSVSHSFNYGSGFTTNLTLSYGHNPGEYIPTFLDVVGKMLYKNNKQTVNLVNKRQGNVFNQEHVGTLVGNTNSGNSTTGVGTVGDDLITNSTFGNQNKITLQKIIDYANSALAVTDNSINPVLEIRVYFNSKNPDFTSVNTYATQLQQEVNDYLLGSSNLVSNNQPTGNTNTNNNALSAFKTTNQVITVEVDSGKTGEFRYPSTQAFYYARTITDKSSQNTSQIPSQQQIDNAIYTYMVDCWIVYNNPQNTTAKTAQ